MHLCEFGIRSNVVLSFLSNAFLFKSFLKEKGSMQLSNDDPLTLHLVIKLVQNFSLIVGSNLLLHLFILIFSTQSCARNIFVVNVEYMPDISEAYS